MPWTFTCIDSDSKLILAWHVGHRTFEDTLAFHCADPLPCGWLFSNQHGWLSSLSQVPVWTNLGARRVSLLQLVKIYSSSVMDETRYSPAECTGARKEVIMGIA